jgi:hypothetical protein
VVWITVQGTSARHRVGMVRTRIPQRAVTQQPRQKGNVAPWTGDISVYRGAAASVAPERRPAVPSRLIGYPLKGAKPPHQRARNSVKRKSPGVPELPGPPEADPARGKGAAYGSAPS